MKILRSYRQIFLLILLSFGFCDQSNAQFDLENLTVERGKPAELKGVSRIYLYSKMSPERHAEMIKELAAAKLPIEIVENLEDAEVVLSFQITTTESSRRIGDTNHPDLSRRAREDELVRYKGRGIAYRRINENSIRVLVSIDQRNDTKLYFRPWNKFIGQFVKEYKRANQLK